MERRKTSEGNDIVGNVCRDMSAESCSNAAQRDGTKAAKQMQGNNSTVSDSVAPSLKDPIETSLTPQNVTAQAESKPENIKRKRKRYVKLRYESY